MFIYGLLYNISPIVIWVPILLLRNPLILLRYNDRLSKPIIVLLGILSLVVIFLSIILSAGLDSSYLYMEGGNTGNGGQGSGGGGFNPGGSPNNGNGGTFFVPPVDDRRPDMHSENIDYGGGFTNQWDRSVRDDVVENGYCDRISNQPYARNLVKFASELPTRDSGLQIPTGLNQKDARYLWKMTEHHVNNVRGKEFNPNMHYPFTKGMKKYLKNIF